MTKQIKDLPANSSLDGSELFEIQKGIGTGSSQKAVLSDLATKIGVLISSLFASAAQGDKADSAVQSVVAGMNTSVDNTDPRNPVVSASAQQSIAVAASDETTALVTGSSKVVFRNPLNAAFTITAAKISLTTAQTSGIIFTVDIKINGTSIFSTLLTIDNTEKTSVTATTPAVLNTTVLAADDEISVDIMQVGDGTAKGLKVYIVGHQ